ncbi:MAG: sodium-dependent transporter [Clostridiales bacterium]|nr:sodium-dependent transporter [Clostridiales bacterium]
MKQTTLSKRHTFSGGMGFVLAAAGSAVGLGNIWRFPYLAAKYGGGIFLLVYIILVFTFGYSLMIAENAIGRRSGKSALDAFGALNPKWKLLGVLATLIPCIILPYYNVIGGWVIRYFVSYVTQSAAQVAGETHFTDMLQSPLTLIAFQTVFTGFVSLVILGGVQKGVERTSTILMPILVILAVFISVYSMTLPGAMAGVKYFFIPNFSKFSISSVLAAMGQMFYSLSLAMGIMVAYGSYLPKESSLEGNVKKIELFDTLIAVIAGLMIIPAVFSFSGGDETALGQGPSLMFVTLPKVFASMSMGRVIGVVFFFLVFAAAITSSISIMETIVSSICDHFGLERKKSVAIVGVGAWLVSLLPALGYNLLSNVHIFKFDILDFMDFVTNSVMMPVCALLTCLFVSIGIGTKLIEDEILVSGKFGRKKLFEVMIKYIAPVLVCAILVTSILNALGVISI